MMRILSKEEFILVEKELNEWLLSLDFNVKSGIKSLLNPLIDQANCQHEWIDPNTYENNLDKNKLFCRFCNLTKNK
jgi:hypothetical protein